MDIISIYANLIRTALIIVSIHYIFKRQYKYLISTAAVFVLTFLPCFLDRVFGIRIDAVGGFLYISIIVMTMYLGNVLKFYDRYFWWDIAIHFLSGIAFVNFGIALCQKVPGLSSFNILFFSFTFSIALHAVWEVLEYASDCIIHSDNQRWQKVSPTVNHASESAIQPAGLVDTMKDIIYGIAGAAVSCLIWWFI